MYHQLGYLPPGVLPVDVTPIFTPKAPPLADSTPGMVLAVVLAITLAGAHLATYDDKQKHWGTYGAMLGGGVAAFALVLDFLRPKA
jgi:hypothetical protein